MSRVRYERVYQGHFFATEAKSIDDCIRVFEANLTLLKRWKEKGVELDPHGIGNSYAIFYTYDEQVARDEVFERIRTEAGNALPRR